MKYIIVITVIGLLLTVACEWNNWIHDVCDCMVNRALEGDETE